MDFEDEDITDFDLSTSHTTATKYGRIIADMAWLFTSLRPIQPARVAPVVSAAAPPPQDHHPLAFAAPVVPTPRNNTVVR